MFGLIMTPKDAQAALEDTTIVRMAGNTAARQIEHRAHLREMDAMDAASMALRQRNELIAKLTRDVNSAHEGRNEVVAAARSADTTIAFLINELAKATGEPRARVQERAAAVRTQAYEQNVEKSLHERKLLSDPRTNGTAQTRDWYRPDLL